MTQLKLAEQIAREAHKNQFRRDGKTSYITHVEKVVELLCVDSDKIVAWLHDVIEDTDETYRSLIDRGISQNIVDSVLQLTKTISSKDYNDYINKLKFSIDRSVVNVKVADIVANLIDKPTDKQIKKYTIALSILSYQ